MVSSNPLIYSSCKANPSCKAKTEAAEQFKKLIRVLSNVGLQTEVRNGDESSLLVFVRSADEKIFGDVVYRSR
jgi:anoctamin-10